LVESFVKKGSRIAVEGKLIHRRFTNRDGVEKEVSEILVKDLLLLEKRQPQSQEADEIEEAVPF
jgi:single-strand DNA-binding protein